MENSKIEWTGHTFNPWKGCSKVSDGCKHCYAEHLMDTRLKQVEWGVQGTRVRTTKAYWKGPLKWNKQAEEEGRRHRVFCASLADVFEDKEDQPEMDKWRGDMLGLIEDTPNLDWLLLTKRPENVRPLIEKAIDWLDFPDANQWLRDHGNVWIGTSVENQEQAEKRIPELLRIQANTRFLSMEPLLGSVDLGHLIGKNMHNGLMLRPDRSEWPSIYSGDGEKIGVGWHNGIDMVIVGGESGHKARPMHTDWARSLRDQCRENGVSFFFKQWGAWLPYEQVSNKEQREASSKAVAKGNQTYFGARVVRNKAGQSMTGTTPGIRPISTSKIGKKKAGRLLDGETWSQMPCGY